MAHPPPGSGSGSATRSPRPFTGPLARLAPITGGTVAELAYAQIRSVILDGDMAPGIRLSQQELAERLQISRTPVREALRRLTGEGLVDDLPQRGFRVADLGLEAVMRRLEVRTVLEPGIARLAAKRATDDDIDAMVVAIAQEDDASAMWEAHDASREFHIVVARATQNEEFVSTLESKWIPEVGRRLIARRSAQPDWLATDVREHERILKAIADGDGGLAAGLMYDHVRAALAHWNPQAS